MTTQPEREDITAVWEKLKIDQEGTRGYALILRDLKIGKEVELGTAEILLDVPGLLKKVSRLLNENFDEVIRKALKQ